MAISLIAVGGWATGTTSASVPYPAGPQAGDLIVMAIGNKYPTNGPTLPTDWVAPSNNQGSGGSGSNGVDSGNVYATIFVKIATGSESGNLTLNVTSGNSIVAQMVLYRKAADKNWDYACTNGADNTAGTSWSVTGAANPGITAGDRIFTCSGINTDSYSFSGHGIAATGVTFGAIQADGDGTNLGQDCYCVLTDHEVSSGTASAAPVFTMTASGTATDIPAGATTILRMREVSGASSIAGTSAGSTTTAGGMVGKGLLSGIGTAAAVTASAIIAIGQLIASVATTSTTTGIVNANGNISGASTANATTTAIISAKGYVVGSSTGTANVTGSTVQGAIVGSSAATSTATATITAIGNVSATSAGIATANSIIVGKGALSGSIVGDAVVIGSLVQDRIIGSASGLSTVTGSIAAVGALSGVAAGTSTAIITYSVVNTESIDIVSTINTRIDRNSDLTQTLSISSKIKNLFTI